jgi:hypothetical protein
MHYIIISTVPAASAHGLIVECHVFEMAAVGPAFAWAHSSGVFVKIENR